MPNMYSERLARLRHSLRHARVDGLLVTGLTNVFYLCGFTGSSAALLVLESEIHLFTDGRYTLQARQEAPEARLHIGLPAPALQAGDHLKRRGHSLRLGFEAAHLSQAEWTRLKSAAGRRVRWKPLAGTIESLRQIKSAAELEQMRQAAALGSQVMSEIIALVRPGLCELDLAAEADYRMRRKGASGPSFETIIASGPRSALPHARPSDKRIAKNELVVIDLGAILRHYCSDLTRTVHVGKASAQVRRWYQAVADAKDAALHALRAGASGGQVDRAARRVLERANLGRYFIHSTGHGLGAEVHEGPRLGRGQKQLICPGNVVTLEPGVYIEGSGGIRIEDDVAVHASGNEILTNAPQGLIEI